MFSIWTQALFLQQRISLQDASQIPAIAEGLFLAFNAHIEIHPVMALDDLVKAGHCGSRNPEKKRRTSHDHKDETSTCTRGEDAYRTFLLCVDP
jgi:hypothetical protein